MPLRWYLPHIYSSASWLMRDPNTCTQLHCPHGLLYILVICKWWTFFNYEKKQRKMARLCQKPNHIENVNNQITLKVSIYQSTGCPSSFKQEISSSHSEPKKKNTWKKSKGPKDQNKNIFPLRDKAEWTCCHVSSWPFDNSESIYTCSCMGLKEEAGEFCLMTFFNMAAMTRSQFRCLHVV